MDRLWREYPHTPLATSQPLARSLPAQVGDSEIGHAMLGTGRILRSDFDEISDAVKNGQFARNPIILDGLRVASVHKRNVHLIGLGDLAHLDALLSMAKPFKIPNVYLHLILDGEKTIEQVEALIKRHGVGTIASLVGSYYGHDRGGHWDRTLRAYRLWSVGEGEAAHSFKPNRPARELPPTKLGSKTGTVQDHDVVIVLDIQADRTRQLVRAFLDPDALRPLMRRQAPVRHLSSFVSLTSPRLSMRLPYEVAFPPAEIRATLPEILAGRGLRQLRISETTKAAHVTSFFNGGRGAPFPGEERIIVPGVKQKPVEHPGMSSAKIVAKLKAKLTHEHIDFALVNFANVDVVGHTGNFSATAAAVRILDACVGDLTTMVHELNGVLVLTADHGNAEAMLTPPGESRDQAHTSNPVPFILVDPARKRNLIQQAIAAPPALLADLIRSRATLADVAPTILAMFGIPIPIEMTGRSLLDQLR